MRKNYVLEDEEEPSLFRPLPEPDPGGQPPRGLEAVLWYALLVLCHLLWGLFPVSCRYLQTRADPPLEPMRLGFLVAAIAAVGLFATYTLPIAVAQKCCRRRIGPAEEAAPLGGKAHSAWETAAALLVLALSLGVLAFGGILAADYTSANWLQLLYMTSPLLVALLARGVLGVPIAPALWPCLAATVLGSGLVVYGGSAAADEGHQLGWTDGVGIGIGAVSMLGMAVFYVYVQKTEGVIAEEHVLYVEYATMCLTLPALSYWLESGDWGGLLRYGWLDWGNLLFASLGVYYGMNLLQQFIIRRIGASLFAMGTALRLVASIAGSWVLMGERIDNWEEWAGSAIVTAAITSYLFTQYSAAASQLPGPVAAAAPNLAPAGGDGATDPLLPDLAPSEITVSRGGRSQIASAARPVLADLRRGLDEAGVAATPGSVPGFSFKRRG